VAEAAGGVLAAADWGWLGGAVVAAGVGELACALRWRVVLGAFGLEVPWWRAVVYSWVGLFYSLGLPGSAGGDAVRVVCVMGDVEGRRAACVFSVVADRLCGLVALGVAMGWTLVANPWLLEGGGRLAGAVVWAAVVLLAGSGVMVGLWWSTSVPVLRRFLAGRHGWVGRRALESGDVFGMMAARPGAVAAGVGLSGVALVAHFGCYALAARAFGAGVGGGGIFAVMPVVDALTSVPVALYGLGVREVLFNELLGVFFGVPAAVATLLSLGGFGAQAVVALAGVAWLPVVWRRAGRGG
jgi:glycosyltransferase 2 family protein